MEKGIFSEGNNVTPMSFLLEGLHPSSVAHLVKPLGSGNLERQWGVKEQGDLWCPRDHQQRCLAASILTHI